jgi:NitT/TauT family transport system permease protein
MNSPSPFSRSSSERKVAKKQRVVFGTLVNGLGERHLGTVLAIGFICCIIVLWWYFSLQLSEFILPPPIKVLERTMDLLFGQGAIHTWTSMARIVISVAIAVTIGAMLVFLVRLMPLSNVLISNVILPFLNSVPALGWAILGVVWFGVGDVAVVLVVTLILVPFTMVNLFEGMKALDPGLIEMGRSFSRSRLQVLIKIQVPLLLPYVFASVRLAFSVGWKVALIAEFFGAQSGLGLVMNRARQFFDTPTVFATIFVVLIIIVVFETFLFAPVSRYFSRRAGFQEMQT